MSTPLVQAAANFVGIPIYFIPEELDLTSDGQKLTNIDVLKRKDVSEIIWEKELGRLIETVISPDRKGSQFTNDDVTAVVQNLVFKLKKETSKSIICKAILGILVLAYAFTVEFTKVDGFLGVINHYVIDKFPLDVFQQIAGNILLNLEEYQTQLKITGRPFEFPPFQKALPYFPSYGYVITTIFRNDNPDAAIQKVIIDLVKELTKTCEKIDGQGEDAHSGFNVGFDPEYWIKWCQLLKRKPSQPVVKAANMMSSGQNFMKNHSKLSYTKGHLWIFLKADKKDDCEKLLSIVTSYLSNVPGTKILVTTAYKKNEGKIFGGQFTDGISNAVDAVSMIREVLIPPMPVEEGVINPEGGAFSFLQFFHFDQSTFLEASQPRLETMIGRDSKFSETLPKLDERSHIKRARLIDSKNGTNTELLRQALPYYYASGGGERGPMGDGLMFVAFGQSAQRFSDIIENMLGPPGSWFVQDQLLSHVRGM